MSEEFNAFVKRQIKINGNVLERSGLSINFVTSVNAGEVDIALTSMMRDALLQQQAHIVELEAAIQDALHGEPLDEYGNRDENGLLRGYSSAYAAYRLAKVRKEKDHE
jgi:hypothetical protein